MNWRGRPLTTHQVIVDLIGNTTTTTGLTVHCVLDTDSYPIGIKYTKKDTDNLPITRHNRQRSAVIPDRRVLPVAARRKQLITRLVAGTCEVCGSTQDIQVHQVRKLADLTRGPKPTWAQLMAKRRRKTLVVCPSCHGQIHAHQPTATITT
jgi:hypothetical protein